MGIGLCDCHQCGRKFAWGEECWHEGDILCSSCFDLEYEKLMRQVRWDKECPVCHEGLHIEKDADFPASMMNCEICGSEWNEDETTMNAREME